MSTKTCHLCKEETTQHCEVCGKPMCDDHRNNSSNISGDNIKFCDACAEPFLRKKPPQNAPLEMPKGFDQWSADSEEWQRAPTQADLKRLIHVARTVDNEILRKATRNPIEAAIVLSLVQAEHRNQYGVDAQIVMLTPEETKIQVKKEKPDGPQPTGNGKS